VNIFEVIDGYAARYPERIAHIHREESITYGALFQKSNRLANYIIDRFEDDNTPIIVYGHKQCAMLVCFLACVKSGHAYIPVDSSLPSGRIEDIVASSASKLILCMEPLSFISEVSEILDFSSILQITGTYNFSPPDKAYRVAEQDVYYIIYTSGSTGKPKGVQITLSNLQSFISWAVPLAGIDAADAPVILNTAPFSFDLSVMDMYISLASGGTLYSIDKNMTANVRELFEYLEKSQVSVCVCTPSFADLCIADSSFRQALLPNLRCFLFCGETLGNKTAEELINRFPCAKIVNLYGPTETTVSVTAVTIDRDICSRSSPLPVGRIKADCVIHILNQHSSEVPEKEHGEIVISGDSVSIGYYNNQEMTDKAFFTYGGKWSYHTGDEGYVKNGMLYYCGRLDFQIKLHGYRIEIEDVENNIRRLRGVLNALVVPGFSDGRLTHLNAFVIREDKNADKSLKGVIAFKNDLKALLPEYMIPKKIIFTDQFPMNTNGKTDRKALALALEVR